MTTFVVPCGISILDGLGRKLPSSGGAVGRFVNAVDPHRAAAWPHGYDQLADDELLASWAKEVADKADAAKLAEAEPVKLCAETHTVTRGLAAQRLRLRELLDQGGRVLLLASDTRAGIAAAFCVATHLAGGRERIAYLSTPAHDAPTLGATPAGGTVTVIRVRQLRPQHADLVEAAAGIGKVLRAAHDLGAPVEVHLTGGFKATLLHTLAMTELLYSMAPRQVSAWYVFEDVVDAGVGAAPIPIGLRHFPDAYQRDMRRELTAVDGHQYPGSETFKGVAWNEDSGRPELNAFGHGYLAVLSRPVTLLGDDGR